MPLPAIAAAVGRGAIAVGRGAVSVGKGAAKIAQKGGQAAVKGAKTGARAAQKGAKTIQKGARKASDIKSQIQKGRRQMQQMQELQDTMQSNEDDEDEFINQSKNTKIGRTNLPGRPLGKLARMSRAKNGITSPKPGTNPSIKGVSSKMQSKIKSNKLSQLSKAKSMLDSQKEGDFAMRDMMAKTIDGEIKSVNTTLSSVDCATGGSSLIVTVVPYMLTYGWMSIQFFYGDLIAKGKHKYIAPLKHRIPPVPVDPNAYLRKMQVILFWIVIIAAGIVQITLMMLMLLALVAPLILVGVFIKEILELF